MVKVIMFDMDGTMVDFYNVPGWLDALKANDVRPYRDAKPLVNFSLLARYLNKLQKMGYYIGIISWGSRNADNEFLRRIAETKLNYLQKHLPSVKWDMVKVIPYGQPKSWSNPFNGGILFDDDEGNRSEWANAQGEYLALDQNSILQVLKVLAMGFEIV